jgi:hypothetical protein
MQETSFHQEADSFSGNKETSCAQYKIPEHVNHKHKHNHNVRVPLARVEPSLYQENWRALYFRHDTRAINVRTMKSASLNAAARTRSISKMTALHCVVETDNRSEDDEDCYLHNISSTHSFESDTTRTASLTDEGASSWETHSTDRSFTSPFEEVTADVTRKSQLQVQFAEQTAEEMAQVMNYWSKYETPKKKTQLSDSDHQRSCLPTNSLILNDDEEVEETKSRMNYVPDLICATPGSAMSHMSAMTPRTPGPSMTPRTPRFFMKPQHFDFMGEDSTPAVPRSPAIPEDPFSPMMTTTLSAEELNWIAREQKSRVDDICWATRSMVESMAEVSDILDEDDDKVVQKLPRLLLLPELAWRDNIVVRLKWQTQLLGDFIFLCVLHMLPLEWLPVCMWLKLKTSVRTKSLCALLVCGLLAASFLPPRRTTNYQLPTALVCWERFAVLDPHPYQYHDYTIDEPTHQYSTTFIFEHEHAFLL